MAVTTIPWGDGSGDNIYLTYDALEGDQSVLVSSDANGGDARVKTVTFSVGNITQLLTVNQAGAPKQYTVTFNPSSHSSSATVSNPRNGYESETSSTYAQMAISKTIGSTSYINFKFDTSSIPQDAIIDSVTCVASAYKSANPGGPEQILMMTDTTSKGEAQDLTTTRTTFTFSGVNWTRQELSKASVRVYGNRTSGTQTAYLRFYGATLTVTYTA